MRHALIAATLLSATSCNREAPANLAEPAKPTAEPSAITRPPTHDAEPRPQARIPAFLRDDESELLDFHYAWPSEAAAIPALDRRFRAELARDEGAVRKTAEEDHAAVAEQKRDWHQYEFMRDWTLAGSTPRLLSLESTVYRFTGGAHGMTSNSALLWDRQNNRETRIEQLMSPGMTWAGAIRQPFCVLLDREREKRRGQPVRKDDMFGECPQLKELTLLLADEDRDSRFDHVRVIADQYVAGPYSEGPYKISLPITATMITRLKPEYRSSFEPQPPVQ